MAERIELLALILPPSPPGLSSGFRLSPAAFHSPSIHTHHRPLPIPIPCSRPSAESLALHARAHQELLADLKAKGVRAEISSGERLGKLVRNAELSKVPVMCVVGKKEAESGAVTVRTYADGDIGSFPLEEFKGKLMASINNKTHFA